MKKFRKLLSLVLAMVMVLAMAAPSFADGTGTITIKNASKGETYTVYKLFDATVANDSIAYTGTIPEELSEYFEERAGYIYVKDNVTAEDFSDALKEWMAKESTEEVTHATADGSELKFTGLAYGYYVVKTTQGAAISVDSLNPNATIYDKNATEPSTVEGSKLKDSDADETTGVAIGDTITYTVKFTTTNYIGAGNEAKKVTDYIITDTLPNYLSRANVTNITINNETYPKIGDVPQFDDNKKITIPWVDADGNSLYDNDVVIEITYQSTLLSNATIDGDGNDNRVTISWKVAGDNEEHTSNLTDTETVYTYALAIQKVDQNNQPLAGATFSIEGIEATEVEKGVYVVSDANAEEDTVMKCDDNGLLIVKGVKIGTYNVTEESAPYGYNKLEEPFTANAQKIGEAVTTTTTYYDAEGEVTSKESAATTITSTNDELVEIAKQVENRAGTMLPSTGGIGTTIFYAAGIILMAGAVFFVVRRKRV